ncbi:MAG: hypothetical protein KDJ39_11970 [Gammaproteobacteria bacterium]|nr:hypothetical protein [Gammaproteobacteria bacterium]
MSGFIKGPLPILVVIVVAWLGYKYLPLTDIVERFQRGPQTAQPPVTVSPSHHEEGDLNPVSGERDNGSPIERDLRAPILVGADPTPAVADPTAPDARDPGVNTATGAEPPVAAMVEPPRGPDVTEPTPAPAVAEVAPDLGGQIEKPPTRAITFESPPQPSPPEPVPPIARVESTPVPKPPVVKKAPAVGKTTAASRPATEAVVAKAAPVPSRPPPAPTLPELRVLVEAETDARADNDRYTPQQYAGMLREELLTAARERLGAANVAAGDANLPFRDDLADGRAGIERLCERGAARRLLLADIDVPSEGFSTIASAYWPVVVFTAINCGDGRLHKSSERRLEPHRLDAFVYQRDFVDRAQQFVASQAYFLAP